MQKAFPQCFNDHLYREHNDNHAQLRPSCFSGMARRASWLLQQHGLIVPQFRRAVDVLFSGKDKSLKRYFRRVDRLDVSSRLSNAAPCQQFDTSRKLLSRLEFEWSIEKQIAEYTNRLQQSITANLKRKPRKDRHRIDASRSTSATDAKMYTVVEISVWSPCGCMMLFSRLNRLRSMSSRSNIPKVAQKNGE